MSSRERRAFSPESSVWLTVMLASRVVYTVRHVADLCIALTLWTMFRWRLTHPLGGSEVYTGTCQYDEGYFRIFRRIHVWRRPRWNCGVRSDLFVWCLLRNICLVVCVCVCVCAPDLTPYDWPLYRTLNLPIDELAWEMSFQSDIFRTTDWYARVTCGVYRTSRDWYVCGHYVINCVLMMTSLFDTRDRWHTKYSCLRLSKYQSAGVRKRG